MISYKIYSSSYSHSSSLASHIQPNLLSTGHISSLEIQLAGIHPHLTLARMSLL